MKLAILSDIHDNADGLARTLQDAERQNADRTISLGDVGRATALFEVLRDKQIPCIYGNWEASGWSRLSVEVGQWVASWPTFLELDPLLPSGEADVLAQPQLRVLFSHATPDMPPLITNTQEMTILLNSGVSWTHVFPRLHRNEQAVWNALGFMEEEGIRAAFHGHTHVQMAWLWTTKAGQNVRKLRAINGPAEFVLDPGLAEEPNRYLIGVGSCGEPHDGNELRYALLDTESLEVELRAI